MKTLKKLLACGLILACAVSTLAGCGKKSGQTFTVGFDAEYPPYGYMDENGEYVGFDLDLPKYVREITGNSLRLLSTGMQKIWKSTQETSIVSGTVSQSTAEKMTTHGQSLM